MKIHNFSIILIHFEFHTSFFMLHCYSVDFYTLTVKFTYLSVYFTDKSTLFLVVVYHHYWWDLVNQ